MNISANAVKIQKRNLCIDSRGRIILCRYLYSQYNTINENPIINNIIIAFSFIYSTNYITV